MEKLFKVELRKLRGTLTGREVTTANSKSRPRDIEEADALGWFHGEVDRN